MKNKGFFEELHLATKEYPDKNFVQRLSPKEYIEVLVLHAAKQLAHKFKRLADESRFDELVQLTEHISRLVSDNEDQSGVLINQ
jgi:hypothetical protein